MKNGAALIKFLLVVLPLMACTGVFAQNYPVTNINISLPDAADANTSNWGNKNSQLSITATSADLTRAGQGNGPGVQDKLLLLIKKDGSTVCGAYNSTSAPKVSFGRLNMVWSGKEAVAFLGRDCVLPSGDYELSVQFFGYANGVTFAISKEVKKKFSISGHQPPDNRASDVAAISAETRPVSPGRPGDQRPAAEQPGAVNPGVATEPKPAQVKKPGLLDRLGKIAISSTGLNGSVTIDLSPQVVCDCGSWSPMTINRTTKIDCGNKKPIPWKCGQPLDFLGTYNCTSKDKSCPALTAWEIKKDGVAIARGEGERNITGEFIPSSNGSYTLTLTASCNGKKCEPCVYTIAVEDCSSCDCGSWGPLTVNNAVKFENGAKRTIQWNCSQPFNFTSTYRCGQDNQDCQAATSWEIDRDGVSVKTGNSTADVADSFTPMANGAYTLTLNAGCNGIKCPPAVYNIVVNDCRTCDCGNWVNPVVMIRAGKKTVSGLKCSESASLPKGRYTITIPDFACSSGDGSCAVTYSWSIRGDRETAHGMGQTFNYDFNRAVVYTVEMTPMCGGKSCRPCMITISIVDDPVTDNNKRIDTTYSDAGKYYYDLDKTLPDQYTELFDHTLNVQFTNNYAAVENIKLNIYDMASHTMFKPREPKQGKLISVTGLNRLSVNLDDYQLEPGRLYLFTVSVFSSNYRLNFKVISDHEK